MGKKLKQLKIFLYPETFVVIGLLLLLVGIYQSILFGYAAMTDYIPFFEEPMDKMTFGLILFGAGISCLIFWKYYKIFKLRLGILSLFFTIFARSLWEVLWVTGSYFPSIYTSWAILNKNLPIFAWQSNSILDYVTNAWYHFVFQFSVFSISLIVIILISLSMVIDSKKKK